MAIEYIKRVTDDIDGSEGATTITFGYRGSQYELDLSTANVKKLDSLLAPWIAAARRPGHKAAGKKKPTGSGLPPEQLQAVRDWANKHGYNVSPRGRVAQDIILAFEQAQLPKEPKTRAEKAAPEFSSAP